MKMMKFAFAKLSAEKFKVDHDNQQLKATLESKASSVPTSKSDSPAMKSMKATLVNIREAVLLSERNKVENEKKRERLLKNAGKIKVLD